MKKSQHFGPWRKVEVSFQNPCAGPEPVKSLYSGTGIGPELGERQGDRRRENGLPGTWQCAVATEAAQ